MKKPTILAIMALVFSCNTNLIEQAEEQPTSAERPTRAPVIAPTHSQNQLVIEFDKNLLESDKPAIRSSYRVIRFEKCECADKNIELWTIGGSNINLENLLGEIGSDPDLEGGDYQYYMNMDAEGWAVSEPPIEDQIAKINGIGNRGVTIAVIDSGVDYNYPGFTTDFLYDNTGNEERCRSDFSGWDFVNQDHNIFDDNGHGTMVTYLIYEKLKQNRVRFNIMPIKAFSERGKTDTYKITCAFQYAAKNKDVDIINMSFGWYYAELYLLSKFMQENDDKLLVASAGNAGVNADSTPHYPSSYEHPNLITVAGLDQGFNSIDIMSNYGVNTIDIAAPGRNINFSVNGSQIYITGTSFSNAYVSAEAAKIYFNNSNPDFVPQELIAEICSESIFDPMLSDRIGCSSKLNE